MPKTATHEAQPGLPLPTPEPTEQQLQDEARRLWSARGYWRAQYASFEALMAAPQQRYLLMRIARACWISRMTRPARLH
jgi:hypothetical protein